MLGEIWKPYSLLPSTSDNFEDVAMEVKLRLRLWMELLVLRRENFIIGKSK